MKSTFEDRSAGEGRGGGPKVDIGSAIFEIAFDVESTLAFFNRYATKGEFIILDFINIR